MSVFQSFNIQSLTQTIFEVTQFKKLCGTYDPLWLISRLNTGQYACNILSVFFQGLAGEEPSAPGNWCIHIS